MPSTGRKLESLACFAAGALAAVSLLSYAVVILAHLDDRYNIDSWLASGLPWPKPSIPARSTPRCMTVSSFGGTRYMPSLFRAPFIGRPVRWGGLCALGQIAVAGDSDRADERLTFVIIRRFGVPRSFALLLATLRPAHWPRAFRQPPAFAPTLLRRYSNWVPLPWLLIWAHDSPFLLLRSRRWRCSRSSVPCGLPPQSRCGSLFEHRREFVLFVASFIGFVFAAASAVQLVSRRPFSRQPRNYGLQRHPCWVRYQEVDCLHARDAP